MAHPGDELALDAAEQLAAVARQEGLAVLTYGARHDLAAQLFSEELHPVTDTEKGQAALQKSIWKPRAYRGRRRFWDRRTKQRLWGRARGYRRGSTSACKMTE